MFSSSDTVHYHLWLAHGLSITGLSQHISGYAVSVGFDATFGALMLSAMMLGNIAMKLVIGAVGIALLTREIFGPEKFGVIYPKLSFLISMGSASSLPLIGYVYDFTGDYSPVLFIAIGFHIVNILLLLIATGKIPHDTLKKEDFLLCQKQPLS